MDRKELVRLRGVAQSLKPTVQVGKDGLTDDICTELVRQLKRSGLVKVRLLPSAGPDMRAAGADIAQRTSSVLVEVRGRTAVLAREKLIESKR